MGKGVLQVASGGRGSRCCLSWLVQVGDHAVIPAGHANMWCLLLLLPPVGILCYPA